MDDDPECVKLLRNVPGNDRCCDCNKPMPEWASMNLGVLMCLVCSGFHRNMGSHISQVRSLELDLECWKGELLSFMCNMGNSKVNKEYEANIPPGHFRPQDYPDRTDVRENFIRSKWERKEFLIGSYKHDDYGACKEGFLIKASGKSRTKSWQRRWFVLSSTCLTYYKKPVDSVAKGTISLIDCETNLVHKDAAGGKEYCLSVQEKGKDRVFLMLASDGMDCINWAHSIRYNSARCVERLASFPTQVKTPAELSLMTQEYVRKVETIIEGGILKSGALYIREDTMFGSKWNLRYVVLASGALYILKSESDYGVVGCAILGGQDMPFTRFEILSSADVGHEFAFGIRTHDRQYFAAAQTGAMLTGWMNSIERAQSIAPKDGIRA